MRRKLSKIRKNICLATVIFVIGILSLHLRTERKGREDLTSEVDVGETRYIQEVPQTTFCNGSNCVLIVGYFRGGTTMTFDVLAQTKNNFHVFEPIRMLTENSHSHIPVMFYNGTVKNITKDELPRIQAEMLVNWFNCDVEKLNVGDLKSTHLVFHSKNTLSYFSCMRKKSIPSCIRMLQSACESRYNRIIKVVRLRVETLHFILKKFKNLKIVYIIRDPRAQINSLVQTKLLDVKEVGRQAVQTCHDMIVDIEAARIIKDTYINIIIVVKYEAIVQNPMPLFRKVFTFTHLNFTEKVETYVLKHLMGSSSKTGSFWLTLSGDAKKISSEWRKSIEVGNVRIIDNVCQDVYKAFGYTYLDINSLRNRDISILAEPYVRDVFDIY